MATAQSITYKLKAEYDGKGDIKQFSADLKSLGQIDALKGLEDAFVATNKQMVDAKAKVRALKQDMKDPGGEAFKASYEKARKEVTKLNTSLQKQKTTLTEARASLRSQGVDMAAVSKSYDALTKSTETQARVIAASKALQVRSWSEIKAEIAGLERAYLDLKNSGKLSAEELAAAQKKLQSRVTQLNASMDSGVKRYSKTATAMQGLRRISTSLITPLTTMVGAIGLLGAGFGIAHLVSDVVRAEKELANMARTAGTSVGDFQAFAFGVKTVGLESDKLADISKDVKDKLGDFAETGGGEFKDFFENIGNAAGVTAEALLQLSGPDALIAVKKAMDDANVSSANQVFYLESIANDASLLMPLLEDNGKAWKELADQAKEMGVAISDLDNQKLLELSKTMDELQLAMGIVKREAVLALAPALKDLAKYVSENTDEIREFVTVVARGVGSVMQFVVENGKLVATLGGGVAALLAVSTTAGAMINTMSLLAPAVSAASAGLAAVVPVAGIAGAALAAVGWGIMQNVSRYQELNKLAQENAALTKSNATAQGDLLAKFKEISAATGVTVTSMKELDKAVADGKLQFNEATGTWTAGYKKISDAAGTSAAEQRRVSGEALEAMKAKYREYAAEVQRLQEQIIGRERSLASELRDMARSGMSGVDAWEDQRKQAEEYQKAAEEAAEAGDFTSALQFADEAKQLYKGLNTEVKENGQVVISAQQGLQTAMDGVKESGTLAIEILKKQQTAASEAMDALSFEGGFDELSSGMDKSKQQWLANWKAMGSATAKEIEKADKLITKLVKDRKTNVYVNVVEKRQSGGVIGSAQYLATGGRVRNMLSGGSFPGYGGGDRRHVVAEDGEVMIRKESVRNAGLRAALAFNAGRFDLVVEELSKRFDVDSIYRRTGGMVSAVQNIPSLPPFPVPQMMSAGGVVRGGVDAIRHEHNLRTSTGMEATVYTDDINAEKLVGILQKAMVSSS